MKKDYGYRHCINSNLITIRSVSTVNVMRNKNSQMKTDASTKVNFIKT